MAWNKEIYEQEYNRFFRGFRLQYDYDNPKRISKRANEVFYEAEAEENYEKCQAMLDAYRDATTLPPREEDKELPKIYDGVVHAPDDLDDHEFPVDALTGPFDGGKHDADKLYDILLENLDEYLSGHVSRNQFMTDMRDLLDDYDNAQRN